MIIDNRDWYKSRLRRLAGYKERVKFRMPAREAELKKSFRLNVVWILMIAFAFFAFAVAISKRL